MSVLVDKNSVNLLSDKVNPRHSLDHYKNNQKDKDAFNEEINKIIDDSLKMMIAHQKNKLPAIDGDSGNDSGASEMLETANLIADLESKKIQARQTQKMVDATLNPGYSATEIQGAEIEYEDGTRIFDGKHPVEFGYKVDFDDTYDGGVVKTTVDVKDEKGNVVHTARVSSEKGDNTFTWDGRGKDKNSNGREKPMPIGSYTIEVKATGSKSGKSFNVRTSTTKTDIVQSVELENGIAKNLKLQSGRNIEKGQVRSINEKQPDIIPDTKVDVDMIGKNVSLNFSKATVKNGSTTINYNNTIKNHENVRIAFTDSKGRMVKQIDYKNKQGDNKLKFGEGQIILRDEIKGLKDGKYTVSITVKDIDKDQTVQLEKYFHTTVVGINKKNNTFHDTQEKIYSGDLIEDVAVSYVSPFDQSRAAYIGKEVEFESDEFTFGGSKLEFGHNIPMPEADGLPFQTKMWIYNDAGELVNIASHDFNPMDMATIERGDGDKSGVDLLNEVAQDEFKKDFKDVENKEDRAELYKKSFEKLQSNAKQYIKGEYRADNFLHQYSWDGQFDPEKIAPGSPTKAKAGDSYHFKLEHVYINEKGSAFLDRVADGEGKMAVREDRITSKGRVSEVSKDEEDNITCTLEDGRTVSEKKIVSITEDELAASRREEEDIKKIKKIVEALKDAA